VAVVAGVLVTDVVLVGGGTAVAKAFSGSTKNALDGEFTKLKQVQVYLCKVREF
jgi:hypothetical protein